ncbi:phosphatidylserine synthase [Rhodonellum psychrophilum GCM71 = DSM 17998]|uniref:CDP-diacylglycerol--serine O-phosphatidyltransferase n=2 Tax=Rhodonellum TaxID=336827 RepID=U5C6A6_9BACT|nr:MULTISPECIES: CDP-diacylglycerol--serine O-phosphatidyltransferase [Rhodonellum]ERM84471.1 phosphatidylserine synthase [Rhodonellum psychrophilum GCM71 = DSM 17998]SDZ00892.1 CDP-diacylglycerol---serine O-phosphatidyltransferase [Rhodonellum ikkaensis]
MNIKKHIPNALTSLNLFSGMVGIYFVLEGNITYGAYFILIAAVFDFLDGFVARLLHVHSEIGKQLDSLADLVTFGVLPAFILFEWIRQISDLPYLPYIALIVGIFSALRLAKFNVDERQSDRFIGVPTPANALFISGLPFLIQKFPALESFIATPITLVLISLVMSFLLVAELPLIALKFKNYQIKPNIFRYITLLIGLVCIVLLGITGIPLVIISYIVLSVLENGWVKNE